MPTSTSSKISVLGLTAGGDYADGEADAGEFAAGGDFGEGFSGGAGNGAD